MELIRLFAQLAMMRKSPEEVPASPVLLALTIGVYFGGQWVVGTLLPPMKGPWMNRLLLDVAFTFVWYALLMYLVKKPERFLQTGTAVYGFQILLLPPSIAIAGCSRFWTRSRSGNIPCRGSPWRCSSGSSRPTVT